MMYSDLDTNNITHNLEAYSLVFQPITIGSFLLSRSLDLLQSTSFSSRSLDLTNHFFPDRSVDLHKLTFQVGGFPYQQIIKTRVYRSTENSLCPGLYSFMENALCFCSLYKMRTNISPIQRKKYYNLRLC